MAHGLVRVRGQIRIEDDGVGGPRAEDCVIERRECLFMAEYGRVLGRAEQTGVDAAVRGVV